MTNTTVPRFGLEDLRNLPVHVIHKSYWACQSGNSLYDWWHHDDFLLVEEIVNACQRNSRGPLEGITESALSVLGEAKLEEARKIAAFRATLPEAHD